ncbi:methyltransferase family protein [Nitrospira sp. Nam80]
MSTLELKVPPAALVVILALAMWFGARLAPSFSFSFPRQSWVISALAAAGALITLLGVVAFRRARTTVDPRYPTKSVALVRVGIYRFSRNPMYVGFLLMLAAWATYVSNLLAFLALPVFLVYMTRFQIIPEEQVLRTTFGRSFVEYERSVRRWL